MVSLPEDFVVTKFYQYVGNPTKNRYNNTYQGSCPMCREGSSWMKKKRFYFIPEKNLVFCHNCGYKKNPVNWISELCNITISSLLKEVQEYSPSFSSFVLEDTKPTKIVVDTLPKDCINLFDEAQIKFYRSNPFIVNALDFLRRRNLLNAANNPKAFYISLNDKFHKNRIIIPFYDENGKIVHYQSRSLDEQKDLRPRYISKLNSEKTIFNIDKIDLSFDTIFIFEGPFNSCFVKNGVAVGGIQENSYQLYTKKQEEQISKFPFHKKVWVLDSHHKDTAAHNKIKKLLQLKEAVFIWPKKIGELYKDFNDICIGFDINEVSDKFIKKYTIN
jgi:hypothetical protein